MRQHMEKSVWPNGYTTRTFRLGLVLVGDFYTLAEALNLNPSELACYLLRVGLDQVQAGALTIPTRPVGTVIDDPRARE